MKIPYQPMHSSLGRLQPRKMDVDVTKKDGWQSQHILVVSEHDERLDFVEREFIRRIGNRLYGRPQNGGRHE